MNNVINEIGLDYEWILLIKEAKKQGLTIEEIRLFLSEVKQHT